MEGRPACAGRLPHQDVLEIAVSHLVTHGGKSADPNATPTPTPTPYPNPNPKARSIGVSNFTVAHLEALKRTAVVWPPSVNQVECHPLYQQEALRQYCAKEGIVLQAYASLGGQDASKVN